MFSSLGPIAFESRRSGNLDIYTVNPDGSGEKQLTFDPANDREPAWSADGRRIAFVSSRGQGDDEIYVMDWNGANQRDVSNHSPGTDSDPAWSPDGQRIVFTRDQDIYTVNADGTGLKPIVTGPAIDYHPSWSPDGIHIAFNSNRSGNADIYMINADGSGPTTQLTNNPSQDYSPAWSPDGQRVAFYSFRDSNWEIYVLNVSDGGATPRRLTSSSSTDASPTWSSDGQWIAYQFSIDNTSVHDEIDAINVNVPSAPVRVDALGAENDHPSW
jgi:Tol biopolymer transport system component